MKGTVKQVSMFLAVLTGGSLNIFKKSVMLTVQKREIWEDEGREIGPVSIHYPRFKQSQELKRLGGVLKNGFWTEWIAPDGSMVYKIVYSHRGAVVYYFFCFADGREFFLRQDRRVIRIIEQLPITIVKRIQKDILREVKRIIDTCF